MADLTQFEGQEFLNIETFRKSGVGVKTPVWFAQDGDTLHVWTMAISGKAKRIRNNSTVNVAPCDRIGTVLGTWIPAQAVVEDDPQAIAYTESLMAAKLGEAFAGFKARDAALPVDQRPQRVSIRVTPVSG
jgi:PPOX class probable F420-dependent enzyme